MKMGHFNDSWKEENTVYNPLFNRDLIIKMLVCCLTFSMLMFAVWTMVTLIRSKNVLTQYKVLYGNLAIADFLQAIVLFSAYFIHDPPMSVCLLFRYIMRTLYIFNLMTLTFLVVDRLITLKKASPFLATMSLRHIAWSCGTIWLLSVSICCLMYKESIENKDKVCSMGRSSRTVGHLLFNTTSCVLILTCTVLVVATNVLLWRNLRCLFPNLPDDQMRKKYAKRVMKETLVLFFLYVVYGPYALKSIKTYFNENDSLKIDTKYMIILFISFFPKTFCTFVICLSRFQSFRSTALEVMCFLFRSLRNVPSVYYRRRSERDTVRSEIEMTEMSTYSCIDGPQPFIVSSVGSSSEGNDTRSYQDNPYLYVQNQPFGSFRNLALQESPKSNSRGNNCELIDQTGMSCDNELQKEESFDTHDKPEVRSCHHKGGKQNNLPNACDRY